jgi:hypothetical protein
MDTVIKAFYIDPKYTIKIGFGRVLRIANVRDSGIIDENVDAMLPENVSEPGDDFSLIAHIAAMRGRGPAGAGDFCRYSFGILGADINDVHCGAIGREFLCNRPANSTPAAGNDRRFSIEAKLI